MGREARPWPSHQSLTCSLATAEGQAGQPSPLPSWGSVAAVPPLGKETRAEK